MAVRNFWIDAYIDGRQTVLSGGPKNKNGGMDVIIYQREEGGIVTAVRIDCFERNGKLETHVKVNGEPVICGGEASYVTQR